MENIPLQSKSCTLPSTQACFKKQLLFWRPTVSVSIGLFTVSVPLSMQLATKAIVIHHIPLCDWFHVVTSGNLPQPLIYWSGNTHFSLSTNDCHWIADGFLGWCEWGFSNWFHSDCQQPAATTDNQLGNTHCSLVPSGCQAVASWFLDLCD